MLRTFQMVVDVDQDASNFKTIPLRALDACVLLIHVHLASKHDKVGFEDAYNTMDDMTKFLEHTVHVPKHVLESALWSCNMLSEQEEFWHPKGLTFDEFVKRMLPKRKYFDKYYNLVKDRER